jgi:hypothetical protein
MYEIKTLKHFRDIFRMLSGNIKLRNLDYISYDLEESNYPE